jgi:hypothetical protein
MNNPEPKPTDDIGTRITLGEIDLLNLCEQFRALAEGNLKQYMRLRGYDLGEKDKGETHE